MKYFALILFINLYSCSSSNAVKEAQVNKIYEDPIHEYYRKLRSSERNASAPKSYLRWKFGEQPVKRKRIRPKSYKNTSSVKNFKAMIDQKLTYFCFQREHLKALGSEQNCQNHIKNTYKRCLTISGDENSQKFVDCINQHLSI